MTNLQAGYPVGEFFDEAFEAPSAPRSEYHRVLQTVEQLGLTELRHRNELRDLLQRSRGVTFTVYADGNDLERTFPLDLVPRLIPASEWAVLEAGLRQRVRALNAYLADIYGDQAILHDRRIPVDLILGSPQYQRAAMGIRPPGGVHIHVAGLDLVRGDGGEWRVLEDNVRTPSGVSYVMENREVMARVLPELFETFSIAPVDHYPLLLLEALRASAPPGCGDQPRIVLLTPGIFNSAYFEHALLARQMGIDLVEGSDLFVSGSEVFVRTTSGPRQVDVIYRRIDDDFLDPLAFRSDSLVGCAGLLNAARAGTVTLANAVGNGISDDKSIYPYVPEMIRYYLGESAILQNVPTFICREPEDRATVLDRLDQLVVKPTDGSGGYGVVIGPQASATELEQLARAIRAHPEQYIAQELVRLSQHPTVTDGGLVPRHVDLRPFIVQGERIEVLPGGLTRVALREGSFVVNSSQGGGSKDTWVLRDLATGGDRTVRAARLDHEVLHRDAVLGPGAEGAREQQQQQQQGGAAC